MNPQTYVQRYKTSQVTAVDRKQLLLLVFEGGQKFLRLTRDALAQGNVTGFAEHMSRAQAIISELMGSLDYKAGGDIAVELARLYDFMIFHLTEANVKRNVKNVENVIKIFDTIANAYREVLSKPIALPASATAAA